MIYTVTFNPALDYVIAVDHFTLGKVNRTVRENIFCGGKGSMYPRCWRISDMRVRLWALWQDSRGQRLNAA